MKNYSSQYLINGKYINNFTQTKYSGYICYLKSKFSVFWRYEAQTNKEFELLASILILKATEIVTNCQGKNFYFWDAFLKDGELLIKVSGIKVNFNGNKDINLGDQCLERVLYVTLKNDDCK